LCDINSEGVVTASDMKSVLNSVYKLVGPELTEDMESADSRVDRAFPAMDRVRDTISVVRTFFFLKLI